MVTSAAAPTRLPQLLYRVRLAFSRLVLAAALCLAFVLSLATTNRAGQHWVTFFQPAALHMAAGGNPYYAYGAVFNPPWVLLPLIPLAWLPAVFGQTVLALASAVGMYVAARRLGASRLVSAIMLLLPGMVKQYISINFDWLAPIGLLLPPWLGLFFVMAKPQLGVGVAIYWLVRAWQRGGLVRVALTFAPVGLAGLISLALYGPWFVNMDPAGRLAVMPWNFSLFPWSIPLGLLLIALAIRRRFPGLSLLGGALLSPYMAYYSWVAATLGLLRHRRLAVVVLIAMLIIGIVRLDI